MSAEARVRAYLARLPVAVSGQGGHSATFRAACRLVEFGLGWEEAWPIFADWNLTHCCPPWGEAELRHKLADAYRRTQPRPEFAQRLGPPRTPVPRPPTPTSPRSGPAIPQDRPAANPAAGGDRRPVWAGLPPLRVGYPDEIEHLAVLRRLSPAGVKLAADRGLVAFGDFRSWPAWFMKDRTGRLAQARRMDGQPWASGVKAWTLRGSQAAWPLGIEEAQPFPVVALVEGGPDLLAAFDLIARTGRSEDLSAVAVLGAAMRLPSEALGLFAGKWVRLFPHADDAGRAAAQRWTSQLRAAGVHVDALDLDALGKHRGARISDLNDLAAADLVDSQDFPKTTPLP